MLSGLSKIFSHRDTRGIDGDKPRDGYMDVLRQIQRPQVARRAPLIRRAAEAFSRVRRGGNGGSRDA
jgi:hypothetical protein